MSEVPAAESIDALHFTRKLLSRFDGPEQEYTFKGPPGNQIAVAGPVSLRCQVIDHSVLIANVEFHEPVDLSECTINGSLRLEDCVFHRGLILRDLHVSRNLFLRYCRLDNPDSLWLDFRRLSIAGIADLTASQASVGIDLSNSLIEDDLRIDGFVGKAHIHVENDIPPRLPAQEIAYLKLEMLTKALNCEGTEVKGHFYAQSIDTRPLTIKGLIDLRAKVGGGVQFNAATITVSTNERALVMVGAEVTGSVFFLNGTKITGQINLSSKVGGGILFDAATVVADRNTTAVNMQWADVTGRVHFLNGTKITGQINLRAKVGGDVLFDAATVVAEQNTLATDMKHADVAGTVCFTNGTKVMGSVSLREAVIRKSIYSSHRVDTVERDDSFALPTLSGGSYHQREFLVSDSLDLSYATVYGAIYCYHAVIAGRIHASHMTVHGDLDFCGCEIAKTNSTLMSFRESDGEREEFIRQYRTATSSEARKAIAGRLAKDWGRWREDDIDTGMLFKDTSAIELKMASVHGRLWMRSSRIHGHVDLEDTKIDGEALFEETTVAGNLLLRSAEVVGRVFADEKFRNDLTSYPKVLGHVDLSFSRLSQVDIRYSDDVDHKTRPSYVNLTGAAVGSLHLRGNSRLEQTENRRGVLITNGLTFKDLEVDPHVYPDFKPPAVKDLLRTVLWGCLWCLAMGLAVRDSSLLLPMFMVAYWMTSFYTLVVKQHTQRPKYPILDMLDQTYPFSRSFYIAVENWFRSSGDSALGDEVFLMRRRRETSRPFAVPAVLKKPAEDDPALTEKWGRPGRVSRMWSALIDFAAGFGVRWTRLVHAWILLFLINWGMFLNPESVEHPLAYIQPGFVSSGDAAFRGPRPAVADESLAVTLAGTTGEILDGSRAKKTHPFWPTDGGTPGEDPEDGPWTTFNAFFMALRVQVPVLSLVAENDWEPSSRRLPFGGVTYEELASLMIVLNFIIVPLVVAGLTQQFRSRDDS